MYICSPCYNDVNRINNYLSIYVFNRVITSVQYGIVVSEKKLLVFSRNNNLLFYLRYYLINFYLKLVIINT